MLEDSKGSSLLGAYAGLASQFGFNLGGSSSSGVFSGDNILLFLKSRLMVEETLLQPVNIHGKPVTLVDMYIDFNKFRDDWQKDTALSKLRYPPGQPRSSFSLLQDSVLNVIRQQISDKSLDVSKPDKDLNFISVKCQSTNELFSKVFTETLVREAISFYVSTKTMQSKVNIDKLQVTADSIENLLNKKSYNIAATQDANLNPAKQRATVGQELQARDKMVLQTMYIEVVKNLELSKMAMAQETPVIRVVDTPILPLEKNKLGKLKGIIIGGFLAGFLVVAFLIARMVYKDIINS